MTSQKSHGSNPGPVGQKTHPDNEIGMRFILKAYMALYSGRSAEGDIRRLVHW